MRPKETTRSSEKGFKVRFLGKKKRNCAVGKTEGFTLIELMVVVALMGILAAIGFGAFGSTLKCEWEIKQASRDLFNDIVKLKATARAQGATTSLFLGDPDCSPNGDNRSVYSYTRPFANGSSGCTTIVLPRHTRLGLPPGAVTGPPAAGGSAHAANAWGTTFGGDTRTLRFNSQGFGAPLLNPTNDAVYMTCNIPGQQADLFGRAIVVRNIGRPQFYKWNLGENGWDLITSGR